MKVTDIGAALDPQFERISDTPRTDHAFNDEYCYDEYVSKEFAQQLERELAEAQGEITRLKGEAQYGATFIQRAIDAERELAELREELNDRRKFAYAVEQALDGLKGDYVEIILAMRKEWVGLTDADFEKEKFVDYNFMSGASFAEAKLREKNT